MEVILVSFKSFFQDEGRSINCGENNYKSGHGELYKVSVCVLSWAYVSRCLICDVWLVVILMLIDYYLINHKWIKYWILVLLHKKKTSTW